MKCTPLARQKSALDKVESGGLGLALLGALANERGKGARLLRPSSRVPRSLSPKGPPEGRKAERNAGAGNGFLHAVFLAA